MASVLLGAAGSAVAGPLGGMLGGAAGSVLDNLLLNHKHVNAPSSWDLLVEASTMGQPIVPVYGRAKLAGNLIMSSNLIATRHSGKGGLTSTKGTPYYTYAVTCAVAICRGPINNIWRMFADSKLIWDMNPDEDIVGSGSNDQPFVMSAFTPNGSVGGVATLYHYGTGKESNTQSTYAGCNFYYGTEEQDVDPYMATICQGLTGNAGLCPAFRGIAYVVFPYLPLADFGNRVPNFSFEVNGYGLPANISTTPPVTDMTWEDGQVYVNSIQNSVFALNEQHLDIYNLQTCALSLSLDLDDWTPVYNGTNPITTAAGPFPQAAIGPDQSLWFLGTTNTGSWTAFYNVDALAGVLGVYPLQAAEGQPSIFGCGLCAYLGSLDALIGFDTSGHYQVYSATGEPELLFQATMPSGGTPNGLCWLDDQSMLIIMQSGSNQYYVLDFSSSLGSPELDGPYNLSSLASPGGYTYCCAYDQTAGNVLIFNNQNIYAIPKGAIKGNPSGSGGLNLPSAYSGAYLLDYQTWMIQQAYQGTFTVYLTDGSVHYISSSTLADLGGSWSPPSVGVHSQPFIWNPMGAGAVGSSDNGLAMADNPTGGPLSLETIVNDICTDAGVPNGVVDASALAPYEVCGYAVTNQASARAAMEPLQEAFLFDLVETNFGMQAKLRLATVQNVTVTISESDLGAREARGTPGDGAVPKVVETVKQDFDLPQYVFFRYKTASGDLYVPTFSFEMATQYAKRSASVVGSTAHLTVNSPLCLTDPTASGIVTNILYLQYLNRISVSFSLPMKYLALDPGDVVNLNFTDTEGNAVSYPVYIQKISFGADNTLQIDGVSTNVSALTDVAAASQTYPGQAVAAASPAGPGGPATLPPGQSQISVAQPIVSGQPTTLLIAETPPLQDSDNDAGFYFGACGVGASEGWGCAVVQSTDGGESFSQIGAQSTPAAIGIAQTALGSARNPVPGVWDQTNTVTIRLIGGAALASVTPVQVCNRQNIFLIGQEIIGAANVTLNSDGSYTLSLLQRGLIGTNSYIGSHQQAEKCMLLASDGSVENEVMQAGQIGLSYLYAGVSTGGDVTGAVKQQYALKGTRITPLSVGNVSLQRDASNNAMITFVPRNRFNFEWQDSVEQVSCETEPEVFEVDIYNTQGAVVRTITDYQIGQATVGNTANADTGIRLVSYTAAQQAGDGLIGAGEEWNPGDKTNMTLSGSNLTATATASGNAGVRAITGASSGLYYFEFYPNYLSSNSTAIGFANSSFSLSSGALGSDGGGNSIGIQALVGVWIAGTDVCSAFPGISDHQWAGIAINLTTKELWVRQTPTANWNGSSTANPATGVGGISISSVSGPLFPAFVSTGGNPEGGVANFGATIFAGSVPSGFAGGYPGPDAAQITATIYQVNSGTVGRGAPYTITG